MPETVAAPEEPVFRLPPYTVEAVFTSRAQSIDWGIEILGVPALWKETRGAGIRVAVLDTGIAFSHLDLAGAVIEAKDFTGSLGGPSDDNGHGTHCAGVIGARDNEVGVVGVANECGLLIGKVLNASGAGGSRGISNGILWAIEQKADIISMSLGSPLPDVSINASIEKALAAGIVVVCAAGNEGPNLDTVGWPAQVEGVISVGAIDRRKQVTRFSSRGRRLDVMAPGDNILSDIPPNNQAIMSGTSMACPHVVGIIALMLAKHRKFGGATPVDSPAQVITHLRDTAIDLGPDGFDTSYGFGLVNPEQLLFWPPLPIPGTGIELKDDDFTPSGKAKLKKAGLSRFSIQINP